MSQAPTAIDARRATRTDAHGKLLLLADQDRSKWDHSAIDEGRSLLRATLPARDRYTIQAAIAAVHSDAPTWAETAISASGREARDAYPSGPAWTVGE